MAAPMRQSCCRINFKQSLFEYKQIVQNNLSSKYRPLRFIQRRDLSFRSGLNSAGKKGLKFLKNTLLITGTLTGGYLATKSLQRFPGAHSVAAEGSTGTKRPDIKPSRSIHNDTDSTGLKLTLFQFQTCPFCCKVRSTLDYYGISYDIIEVNSVLKTQIRWSDYKKVPILLCDGVGKDGFMQINDSSVIISVLETFLFDPTQSLESLKSFFPGEETKDKRGKKVWEFQNKYFIMFQENISDKRTPEERAEERRWRQWTDDELVHVLSPNAYRTPSEALQAFNYFSEVGEWEKNFSTLERLFVVYVGASVMYLVSKRLKKRHALKDDVRESLYDAARYWTKAVGKRKYLGGDQPNLADLSVYGVLSSIEGCDAFKDMLDNTKIGPWFYRTKKAVIEHQGANPLNKKDKR